jgi:hypothetical protein
MTIRWNCKEKGCYKDISLPNWQMLNGCFGKTTVGGSDVDGVVYQNGKCLFLEKKFPRGILEQPQIRMINALVGQGNSYIAIWCESGDGSDIEYIRVWGMPEYDSEHRFQGALDDFRAAVGIWWTRTHNGRCI